MKIRSFDPFSPGEADMSTYPDDQLVLEALDDSHQAFGQLIKQYQYRVLRTIASIISDREAAQDVAQETFLSAWSDLAKLKEREKFGRWLNRIAINLSKDWLRDQRKHNENRIPLDESAVVLIQELRYQRDRLRQEVWEAIDELSADYREAVILYYISGYSYKEISQMLSVPVSTVQGRLQQARNQLRKEFLDMVTQLQLEIDSTVHKFLKERAKQDGLSIEGLIIRLIERYKRDMDNPEMAVRRISDEHQAKLSPDGRYFSFPEWYSANLAVRDLTTGEDRNLTDEGTWDGGERFADEFSVWSPDGKQIAYDWWNEDHCELRIVGLDGSKPRVLYRCENNEIGIHVHDWSQDGKFILAGLGKTVAPWRVKSWDIALVSVADGSVRVLKSIAVSRQRPSWQTCWSLSPDGRYVVYARPVEKHNEARDIFLLATDGSGEEVPLVEHPADDYGPAWAPDGKTIVFGSDRSGSYDIWLIQVADGKPVGEAKLVKKDTGVILYTGFTREGSFYYSPLGRRTTDVCTASVDPATGELLTPPTKAIQRFEGHNHSPAWSPDGKSLAYASSRPLPEGTGRRGVLVIRSEETGEERELYPEVELTDPRWSPDGRSILSRRSRRETLHLIDVQTGDATPIVQFDPNDEVTLGSPAWSPDGKAIIYGKYLKSIEYSPSIVMRDLGTGKEKELCEFCQERPSLRGVAVSPDGRQLAFAGIGESTEDYACSLKLMPIEGGEPREIPGSQDMVNGGIRPAWTPDGRYVLFGKVGKPIELWRIPTEGGEPQKLLEMGKPTTASFSVSVHPDGQRIAFTMSGSGETGTWAIDNFLPGFTASK